MSNCSTKYTVIYDAECPLCKRFTQALGIMDSKNRISFKELLDQSVYLKYPQLSQSECAEIVHMIDHKGNIYKGGEVISELAKTIPGVSKISWLIDSESSQKASDFFYNSLNKIRKFQSTMADCPKCQKNKKKNN